ncbi:chitinase [Streptomyces sp. 840.1]|uniref:glycosyl hydrolase family 18 protein n=1 Tax=Streptomyces sp. 840.1 TaxID=2485152 RepID=UPI000FB63EB8|nr:glycosyl hydrolase family 18 protein [Streptomyces sp. 840.1]ROQ63428.1 chitinase [Streptomyces sp. 840.1]
MMRANPPGPGVAAVRGPARRTALRHSALAVAAVLVASAAALAAVPGSAAATDAELLANPGFETGSLDGWTCAAGAASAAPAHSGSGALAATTTASDTGRCSQTVTVRPKTTYTLAGWVQGSYVYLGATGTGVDASAWAPDAASWKRLSTTFTTGAGTTSVTVFTHGWYGQGTYHADDLTLTGPAADPTEPPTTPPATPPTTPPPTTDPNGPTGDGKVSTPTGLVSTKVTGNAVVLKWNQSTDSSQNGDVPAYKVYAKGAIAATSMGTTVAVSSLQPRTSYTFTVQGYDRAGHASGQSAPVTVTTGDAPAAKPYASAYFDQWGIYENAYYPKQIGTSGAAAGLDVVTYAFENVHPTTHKCFEAIKASDAGNEDNPNAGDGAGDAYADYQADVAAGDSVDGTADVYEQPLKGNFNQLRALKAKYPNLRLTVSLGGWTYSKYFSDAAATDASRKAYVSSCIDMFMKGNLPKNVQGDPSGGVASAAGIFDGIDIDWEYPGSAGGHTGNHYAAADKANFTLLLKEFRTQLDAYGATVGKKFLLTAALPSGQDKIKYLETDKIGAYLDYADVMTYDMHGSWDATGPTNHQDPLHDSPADPTAPIEPGGARYNLDTAVTAYTEGLPEYGISGGFPASKLVLGVPFYWRGWTGVPAGTDYGLYQSATGPTPAKPLSQEAGLAAWKELNPTAAQTHWDPVTASSWIYDGTNFWTGDTPRAIEARAAYAAEKGLAGMFAFSLENDDASGTLLNAMTGSLG